MIETSAAKSRAFAVCWKDLRRWSVNAFGAPPWKWPRDQIKKLSFALERRLEPVDKRALDLRPENFVSLRFTGKVERRELHGKTEFRGNLFFAYPGDIIYSKIDVRNGAIGIVPSKFPFVTVTSEFPVYRIKTGIAVSEYVQLVFRTEHFRQIINSMVSGTSGRKRVQPDDLENVEIPLPPVAKQKAIVDYWHQAQKKRLSIHRRIKDVRALTESRFFVALGLRLPELVTVPKVFAVRWQDFSRWGLAFNFLSQRGVDLLRGTYPVVTLDSVLEVVQYGTSEKASSSAIGLPVLRINNIKDGVIDLSDLKHIALRPVTMKGLLLKNGDVLIIRTSGSRDLVGTCAVFHEAGEFVFASYLIRLRFNGRKVIPDFVSWFLNSPLGRQQVNAVSRKIMQNNINSEELRALRIPLPPLDVQKQVMGDVERGLVEISREREASNRITREANREVEALILGTKKLNEGLYA